MFLIVIVRRNYNTYIEKQKKKSYIDLRSLSFYNEIATVGEPPSQ
jgi:hypothetical protein